MSFSQLKRSNSDSDINWSPKAKKHHIDESNTWLNNASVFSSVELTIIENSQDTFDEAAYFFNFIHYDVELQNDMDIFLANAEADAFFLSDTFLAEDDDKTDEESDKLLAEDDVETNEESDNVLAEYDAETDVESDKILAEDDVETDEDFFIYFLFDIQSCSELEVDLDCDEVCAVAVLTNLK